MSEEGNWQFLPDYYFHYMYGLFTIEQLMDDRPEEEIKEIKKEFMKRASKIVEEEDPFTYLIEKEYYNTLENMNISQEYGRYLRYVFGRKKNNKYLEGFIKMAVEIADEHREETSDRNKGEDR